MGPLAGMHPIILAYHHVVPRQPSRYAVTSRALERQLGTLLARGAVPISLDEAIAKVAAGTPGPPSFTVTFDDGLGSFHDLAMPVLRRLGLVRSTAVFVPTAYVGRENAWRTEPTLRERLSRSGDLAARLLSWEEMAALSAEGVSFQSHGHRHVAMQELDYEKALEEASASRAALEEHGFDARYLAFPFGWRSHECKRAVRDAGFRGALSVQWGGVDEYEVRRVPIYGTDTPPLTRLKLSGRFFGVLDRAAAMAGRRHETR